MKPERPWPEPPPIGKSIVITNGKQYLDYLEKELDHLEKKMEKLSEEIESVEEQLGSDGREG